jgi:hypothetical protein
MILLIFTSQVARIAGISHWCPAKFSFLGGSNHHKQISILANFCCLLKHGSSFLLYKNRVLYIQFYQFLHDMCKMGTSPFQYPQTYLTLSNCYLALHYLTSTRSILSIAPTAATEIQSTVAIRESARFLLIF